MLISIFGNSVYGSWVKVTKKGGSVIPLAV